MQSWEKLIWVFVSLLFAALLLNQAASYTSTAQEIAAMEQAEINSIDRVKEYREFNSFNNTLVYSQDIIGFLIQYQGFPEVAVYNRGATSSTNSTGQLVWSISPAITWVRYGRTAEEMNGSPTLAISTPVLYEIIPLNNWFSSTSGFGASDKYKAFIQKDVGGTIVRINFVRQ